MSSQDAPPSRIGSYRLEHRLGVGGMGEVYSAYDEQLERRVAIKLIRPEAAGDARARRRFRREARAAAALNHPAIVQIHHVTEVEDRDAIVMELVAGSSLAQRIKAGPLPLEQVLRLAIQIADGLSEAHRQGVLHRDLKAENIMVTPVGDAKILDFGLARRWGTETHDGPLSEDGLVVGTCRAMSPEQARGMAVDPRSDLFALGVLLYEMLSGSSPFLADRPLDTLNRVCAHQQAPLSELNPVTRGAWARLVDQLLEKDPARRPGSAAEVVAVLERLQRSPTGSDSMADGSILGMTTLVEGLPAMDRDGVARGGVDQDGVDQDGVARGEIQDSSPPSGVSGSALQPLRRWGWSVLVLVLLVALASAGLYMFPRAQSQDPPLYVAVPQPTITGGSDSQKTELMAAGLRVALLRALLGLDQVMPLSPELIDPVQGSPVEIARAVAADEVVTARLDCIRETCQVALQRILGQDGRLLWAQSFSAPSDRPYTLADGAGLYLRQGYAERGVRSGLELAVQPADYEEYLRLQQIFVGQGKASQSDQVLEQVEALRGRAPRFPDVYELEANILRLRFHARRDPADLERALKLLGQARELFPADPRLLFAQFEIALTADRLGEAEEALTELARLQPGDAKLLICSARLLEKRGLSRKALETMRRGVVQQPSWIHLARLAEMEGRLGEMASARATLEQLLERFPGNRTGLTMLAQIELLTGSPERAVALYTDLVARAPRVTELSNLGVAYLLLRRYAEAQARFRQAFELAPGNPFVVLNLADATLLEAGEPAARPHYEQVLTLVGSADTSDWQLLSVRAQALAHLGRHREAVENVQQVLALARDNPQASHEAAVVYALAGDQSSALVNVERALAHGVERIWFQLPWFDALRTRPDFAQLVNPPVGAS